MKNVKMNTWMRMEREIGSKKVVVKLGIAHDKEFPKEYRFEKITTIYFEDGDVVNGNENTEIIKTYASYNEAMKALRNSHTTIVNLECEEVERLYPENNSKEQAIEELKESAEIMEEIEANAEAAEKAAFAELNAYENKVNKMSKYNLHAFSIKIYAGWCKGLGTTPDLNVIKEIIPAEPGITYSVHVSASSKSGRIYEEYRLRGVKLNDFINEIWFHVNNGGIVRTYGKVGSWERLSVIYRFPDSASYQRWKSKGNSIAIAKTQQMLFK